MTGAGVHEGQVWGYRDDGSEWPRCEKNLTLGILSVEYGKVANEKRDSLVQGFEQEISAHMYNYTYIQVRLPQRG
jgi:hypothetical protein